MPRKPSRRQRKIKSYRLLPYLLLGLCVLALLLGGYTLYLDHVIRQRFEGARWKLPAHVYARPLQLYGGLNMDLAAVRHALQNLGYRRESHVSGPGTYSIAPNHIDLVSRPFQFWNGKQTAQRVRINFKHGQIAGLHNLGNGSQRGLLRLDPMLIGSIYPASRGADRIPVKLDQVPKLLTNGLIAVEDRHFRTNIGLDFGGIARAALADLRAGRIVQGGSTISQQLVKNLFLNNRRTLWRKFNGAIMAVLLNVHYSKNEILQTYLNEVYLGQEGNRAIRGFGLASRFYFHAPLSELQPQQIALLVGMVKGPGYYNPRTNPKRALARRNTVLQVFQHQHLISAANATEYEGRPLGVASKRFTGTTAYPAFVDMVKRQLLNQYSEQQLTTEGLRIFTTLSPQVESKAKHNLDRVLDRVEKSHHMKQDTLQGAVVVTSTQTGNVLAVIGGRGSSYAGYNRALDARREIGSIIKPAIYLTALEQPDRYTLITPLADKPITVKLANGKVWKPVNFTRKFHGEVPLYLALAHSYNVATVHLGLSVGVNNVMDTLRKLGLKNPPSPLPSRLLGAINLSPVQVAQIYSTLASGGFYTPLQTIRAVTTQDGKTLKHYPLQVHQTIPQAPAYLVEWAMQQVMRQGTGQSAYDTLPHKLRLAGKTGTTNGLRDSWFAGFGANHLAVVWVGRDDDKRAGLTGATGALQVWSHLMHSLHAVSLQPVKPNSIERLIVEPKDGLRADSACPGAIKVPFIKGSEPKKYAPCAGGPVNRAMQWLRHAF